MPFPLSPIAGATTTTNNINYIYAISAGTGVGYWTRVYSTSSGSSGGTTTASGTGTTTTFVIQNMTQSSTTQTGALQVWGGAGIGGNVTVGGAVQWVNSQTGVRAVYQVYNTLTNSLDTIFG